MHHPPFSTVAGFDKNLYGFLINLSLKFKKIKLILTGHAHIYECFIYNHEKIGVKSVDGNENANVSEIIGENRKKDKNYNNKGNLVYLITSGGGGGNLEKAVLRSMPKRPYRWSSNNISNSNEFFKRGNLKNSLRNDEFVKKFHHKSVIINHYLEIKIIRNKISIKVLDWNGKKIDELEI